MRATLHAAVLLAFLDCRRPEPPDRALPSGSGVAGSASPRAISGVEGRATVGPIAPVCLASRPCEAPLGGARVVADVATEDFKLRAVATADSDGQYRLELPPGRYNVRVESSARSTTRCETATASIAEGEWTHLDVRCDTGIR